MMFIVIQHQFSEDNMLNLSRNRFKRTHEWKCDSSWVRGFFDGAGVVISAGSRAGQQMGMIDSVD